MQLGLSIGDDFFSASLLGDTGVPFTFTWPGVQREFKAELMMSGRHAYTGKSILPVKIAQPHHPVFSHIITASETHWQDIEERSWSRAQLLAVLLKKILLTVNTQFVSTVDKVRICLSSGDENLQWDMEQAFFANGIESVSWIDCEDAVRSYIHQRPEELVIVTLDEGIFNVREEEQIFEHLIFQKMYDQIEDQELLEAIQSDDSGLDTFLFIRSLEEIWDQILNDRKIEQFSIVLSRNIYIMDLPFQEILDLIRDRIDQQLQRHLSNLPGLYLTGRLVVKPLIRRILEDWSHDMKHEIFIDAENEARVLGLFNA